MATFQQPKTSANTTILKRIVSCVIVGLFSTLVLLGAVPSADASTKTEPAAEEDAPTEPVIPDTVIIPDPVSLTVVLPKSGTIRQLVFNIWLEAATKQDVEVFDAPALLPPPPAKTEEELEAEAKAAEEAAEKGEEITPEPPFSPFAPVPNRYFSALQFQLQKTAQSILPPDTLRSVQVRKFYDHWPGDAKKR